MEDAVSSFEDSKNHFPGQGDAWFATPEQCTSAFVPLAADSSSEAI